MSLLKLLASLMMCKSRVGHCHENPLISLLRLANSPPYLLSQFSVPIDAIFSTQGHTEIAAVGVSHLPTLCRSSQLSNTLRSD